MTNHDRGDRGPQGEPGVSGRQGEAGITGREGEVGEKGRTGATGDPGATGRRGAQGEQPKLRWAPMVGYALLVLLMLALFAWTIRVSQQLDQVERRVERVETDVSLLRE